MLKDLKLVAVSIGRPFETVYRFVRAPQNLPKWASGLAAGIWRAAGAGNAGRASISPTINENSEDSTRTDRLRWRTKPAVGKHVEKNEGRDDDSWLRHRALPPCRQHSKRPGILATAVLGGAGGHSEQCRRQRLGDCRLLEHVDSPDWHQCIRPARWLHRPRWPLACPSTTAFWTRASSLRQSPSRKRGR